MLSTPIAGTLGEALESAASRWPHEVGWVFEDEQVTRAEMFATADRVAAALLAHGVRSGDRVAVLLSNQAEWAELMFGCARIGAILVPLNTRWKSDEIGYVLDHASPCLMVMQRHLLRIDFAELLKDLGWRGDSGAAASLAIVEVGGTGLPGATSWEDFLDSGTSVEPEVAAARESAITSEDPVLLQYTSGSTARPKGALIPHRMALNYGIAVIDRLDIEPGEKYLNPQPLYHVAGSCIAVTVPLSRRITSVMPHLYDVLRVLQLTEQEQCVARGGTSTMYIDEMNHPRFRDFDTSSLRSGWVGAPPAVLDRIHNDYPVPGLVNLYAATEGGGTWGDSTEPWAIRRVSVGRAISGAELRIRDTATAAEMPVDQIGEIGFRGWNQMLGYFRDSERTAESFDNEGFLYLGDLGYLDEAGYLYFAGRIKDMIRSGGENVAAEEVETFLSGHPAIRQVSVIGREDERMGEVVVAVVQPVSPGAVSAAEVIEYCRGKLAGFRTPRAVHFVETWPMTASGKIHKPTLRDQFR